MRLIAAITVVAAFHAAAQTPAGWQMVRDRRQLCQMAVPPGWTADRIMPSNLTSRDKSANVIFSSKAPTATYAGIVRVAKQMFKPAKTYEETANRTWFASPRERGKPGTLWYVAMNSSPVCEAQIDFEDPDFEPTAKQMVNSLKPVK